MICVFLADGFEEIEALTPADILRRVGCNVKIVSVGSLTVCGAHGINVIADIVIEDLGNEEIDMIILPGGMPGVDNLEKCKKLISIIKDVYNADKYIGAICAAPKILGSLGMLSGKKAVCFPGFESYLTGAEIVNEKAVIDGKIITSKGAGTAFEFAFALVSALYGNDIAKDVEKKIFYRC